MFWYIKWNFICYNCNDEIKIFWMEFFVIWSVVNVCIVFLLLKVHIDIVSSYKLELVDEAFFVFWKFALWVIYILWGWLSGIKWCSNLFCWVKYQRMDEVFNCNWLVFSFFFSSFLSYIDRELYAEIYSPILGTL